MNGFDMKALKHVSSVWLQLKKAPVLRTVIVATLSYAFIEVFLDSRAAPADGPYLIGYQILSGVSAAALIIALVSAWRGLYLVIEWALKPRGWFTPAWSGCMRLLAVLFFLVNGVCLVANGLAPFMIVDVVFAIALINKPLHGALYETLPRS